MPPVNRLLSALPPKDRRRFLSGCESVELAFGAVLTEPGDPIHHVYFPTQSFISLVMPVSGHSGLEVGLVGDEGMLGISLILGVDRSPFHAVVQGEGMALRLDAALFCHELALSSALQGILKRYIAVVLGQLAQTAACSRFHVVEARLARWLLMSGDRAHSPTFHVTHEFLASMLGVRRVGVTKAASSLQARGLIGYRRGDVTIVDRAALESVCCGCYAADNTVYSNVMG